MKVVWLVGILKKVALTLEYAEMEKSSIIDVHNEPNVVINLECVKHIAVVWMKKNDIIHYMLMKYE